MEKVLWPFSFPRTLGRGRRAGQKLCGRPIRHRGPKWSTVPAGLEYLYMYMFHMLSGIKYTYMPIRSQVYIYMYTYFHIFVTVLANMSPGNDIH